MNAHGRQFGADCGPGTGCTSRRRTCRTPGATRHCRVRAGRDQETARGADQHATRWRTGRPGRASPVLTLRTTRSGRASPARVVKEQASPADIRCDRREGSLALSLSLPTRHRRAMVAVLLAIAVAVPLLTLPSLPQLSWWPALAGLAPWVLGKYVLCPLRWHALSESGRTRRWHIRAYAEAELCGLLTPGHVGADAWRVRRLTAPACRRRTPSPRARARPAGRSHRLARSSLLRGALPARMLLTPWDRAGGEAVAVVVGRRSRTCCPPAGCPRRARWRTGVACRPPTTVDLPAAARDGGGTGHSLGPWPCSRVRRQPAGRVGAWAARGEPPRRRAVVALAGLRLRGTQPWARWRSRRPSRGCPRCPGRQPAARPSVRGTRHHDPAGRSDGKPLSPARSVHSSRAVGGAMGHETQVRARCAPSPRRGRRRDRRRRPTSGCAASPGSRTSRASTPEDVLALRRRSAGRRGRLQALLSTSAADDALANWVYIWGHWPVIARPLVWLAAARPHGSSCGCATR
jgi:hypothetical protein